MRKIRQILSIIICLILLCSIPVSAKSVQSTPYLGYEFNEKNQSIPAPVGYTIKNISYDYDMKFAESFGSAGYITFDGTDAENLYLVINTGSKILKADTKLNIIADYAVATGDNTKSVVLNNNNGYIFVPAGSGIDVYNTNGKYVKRIAVPASKVIRVGDDFENFVYALSGSTLTILDGEGNTVETVDLGYNAFDICYSSTAAAVYLLTSGAVVDYTNGETYPIAAAVSPASSLVTDGSGSVFYVLTNGVVQKVDISEESVTAMNPGKAAIGIGFNADSDNLMIMFSDAEMNVDVYNSNGFVKNVKGYNFRMNEPSDILYNKETGFMYIMDGGNGRIIKTDKECTTVLDIYESFINGENQKINFIDASGLWINKEKLYIADTEGERVIVARFDGSVIKIITMPDSLKELNVPFKASKILTDRNDRIYVIADSINMGALVFNSNYEYENFFGSNTVQTTANAILNYIKRKFLNKEQQKAMENITPISLANFDIDKDGFIYIVTETRQLFWNTKFDDMLRKVNYISKDILGNSEEELMFGDVETTREHIATNTSFNDIDIAEGGWINAVDYIRGKVFQYSPEGQFVTSFGGAGSQYGYLSHASAIESVGELIYVIDSHSAAINIYEPTEYVTALHDAFNHMDSADVELAVSKWDKVLDINSNNVYAYYGRGVAYENAGEYEKAMENFKMANAKPQYSKAYKECRKDFVDQNLWWIVLVIVGAIVGLVYLVKWLAKMFVTPEDSAYSKMESKYGMPIYALLHPADGFAQFRTRGIYSMRVSAGIVIAFFVIKVIEFFATGFIFNSNKPVDYDLVATIGGTILIFVLFIIGNLAIASFLDGKGKLKHIIAVTAYAMIPMLVSMLVNIALSNMLSLDEQIFMSIISVVGYVWSGLVLIMGMITIHEYGFIKTLVSLVLTVFAMVVFAVLVVLLLTLLGEAYTFIETVIYEISLR